MNVSKADSESGCSMSIVGAGGGFANPNLPQSGYGARIDAVQNFTQGDKLIMVVGQQGLVQSNDNATFFQIVSLWGSVALRCIIASAVLESFL